MIRVQGGRKWTRWVLGRGTIRVKSSFISRDTSNAAQSSGVQSMADITTFVSKHHTISPADLSKVVGVNGHFQDYRLKDTGELHVKTCFSQCGRGNKGMADNAWKLTIRRDGSFYCYRCGDKGNWYQLKQRISGGRGVQVSGFSSSNMSVPKSNHSPYPSSREALGYDDDIDNEIEVLHSNIRNAQVQNKKKEIVLPNQRDAFGYHLDLTAAIYGNNAQSYSEQAAAARKELEKLEQDAARTGNQLKVPSVISRALVREYLRQERGLSDDVIVRYGVGCASHPFPIYSEKGENDDGGSKQGPVWTDKVSVTFPWFSRKTAEDEAALAKMEGGADAGPRVGTANHQNRKVVRPEGDSQSSFFIRRIKLRAVDTKGMQRTLPKGGGWGFFGWQTVQPHHKSVIITEGEYDAMAVAQGLAGLDASHELAGIPAISLPNGCNSLPPTLLPCLEQFEQIYLWLDNDQPGQEASDKFARKLGIHRCRVVRPPDGMKDAPKDANDALRMVLRAEAEAEAKTGAKAGVELKDKGRDGGGEGGAGSPEHRDLIARMLLAAQPISHERLETFSSLRGEVLRNIRQPQSLASGAAINSMPQLNSMLKGLRKGELCVLTGPTGCGKTTLLSQISLDLARQGAATLWGSFEIQNAMLLEKMMQQYGGINLKTLTDDGLESLADDFEGLPLKFMNFHAGTDMSQVLEAMDFAVYRDDVQHIIIDNLQFMMPRAVIPGITSPGGVPTPGHGGYRPASNFDRFTSQDAVIDEFRRFATEKKVNIILVIHPRKEDDNQMLGMSSIFGSAKATQEADIVLILQRIAATRRFGGGVPPGGEEVPESMALSVKKNRYSGYTGKIDIAFNPAISRFYECKPDKSKGAAR